MFVLLLCFIPEVAAQEQEKPSYIPVLSINDKIKQLSLQNEASIDELNVDFYQLNAAEKYLFLMIKANEIRLKGMHEAIIFHLSKAQQLESAINADQLNQTPFIFLYERLANSYAATKRFKEAVGAHKKFMVKHAIFLKNEREKLNFTLEKNYSNAILNNQQNKDNSSFFALKENLTQSIGNQVTNKKNIYLVSFIGGIFAVLLFHSRYTAKRIQTLFAEDPLTGLLTRQAIFEQGESIIKQCTEQKQSLCLIAININDFSSLNKQYGDFVGDELLKQFAALVNESMRTRDVFSRIEDATYVAVLPQASVDQAKALAEHLKEKMSNVTFNYIGISEQISVSIGISSMSDTLNNFEMLLNSAMKVLYEIKGSGGKSIKVHIDKPTPY